MKMGFTCLALQQRRRLVNSGPPSHSRHEEPPQRLCCLTPGVLVHRASVSDLAGVFLSCCWSEDRAPGQMELPALLEGQVGLVGILQLLLPSHQLDGDVRWVELGHMTDQYIFHPELCRVAAVDHHLGSLCRGRGAELVRMFTPSNAAISSCVHRASVTIYISSQHLNHISHKATDGWAGIRVGLWFCFDVAPTNSLWGLWSFPCVSSSFRIRSWRWGFTTSGFSALLVTETCHHTKSLFICSTFKTIKPFSGFGR